MGSQDADGRSPLTIQTIVPGTEDPPTIELGMAYEAAIAIFEKALAPALRDDRFQSSPPEDLLAAVGFEGDEPVGFLGGSIDRDRLQLDAVLSGGAYTESEVLIQLYQQLAKAIEASGASIVEVWGKPAETWHRDLADKVGFSELRALHQLRCVLPTATEPLVSRAFVPGQDEEALIRVNNRAFASHPDQGAMTLDDLAAAAEEPWFAAEGIRLYDDPDASEAGRLAGFCWTKIHESLDGHEPRLGEIYAIGIDPDHHGKGLGRPMTAAGLVWLAEQGLTTGMLYVEADNEPALKTYAKLGFTTHRTDRAWFKTLKA